MEFTYTVRSGQEPQNGRLTPKYTGRHDEGWTPTGIGGAAAWIYYGWFLVIFQYSKVFGGANADKADFPPMIIHVVYEAAERSDELAKQALRYALNALRTRMLATGLYLD
jgi:hypothetical protein